MHEIDPPDKLPRPPHPHGGLSPEREAIYLEVVSLAHLYAQLNARDGEAADLAQSLALEWLELWSDPAYPFVAPEYPAAFARAAVRNRHVNALKAERRHDGDDAHYEYALDSTRQAQADPARPLDDAELKGIIDRALAQMPADRRRALKRVCEDEAPYEVVASEQQLAEGTVRVHVKNAMEDVHRAVARYLSDGAAPEEKKYSARYEKRLARRGKK